MKLSKIYLENNFTNKKRALRLLTYIFFFFFIKNFEFACTKGSNLLKTNNHKYNSENYNADRKSQLKGIEEQDITINILNNETYFIGSAKGKIKLKQNQINLKNKNYYGGVINVVFNQSLINNLTNERNNTQIILSSQNHFNDFMEYFPNFGKTLAPNEIEIDLRSEEVLPVTDN